MCNAKAPDPPKPPAAPPAAPQKTAQSLRPSRARLSKTGDKTTLSTLRIPLLEKTEEQLL